MEANSVLNIGNIFKVVQKLVANKKDKEVRLVDILKEIPSKDSFNPKAVFPKVAMLKSLILMRLKDIDQTKLASYLRARPDEALALGFRMGGKGNVVVPCQQAFSYFVKHRLTKEDKWLIEKATRVIEEISAKFGLLLDFKFVERKKEGTPKTQRNRKERKARELRRILRKRIYPQVGLNLRHNCIYELDDFLDLMTSIAMAHGFAESGCEKLKLDRHKVPSADALLYQMKKFDSIEAMQKKFCKVLDYIFRLAKKHNIIDKRKPVDLAIDYTEVLFYGDKNTHMVVRKKFENGTSYCHKYATASIVENGKRFILMALPVSEFQTKERIVEKLIKSAMSVVPIRKVYLDRGFYSIAVIRTLNRLRVNFIMPAPRNASIKNIIGAMNPPFTVPDYVVGKGENSVRINLFFVRRKRKRRQDKDGDEGENQGFATNIKLRDKDNAFLDSLADCYGRRWGIESSYNQIKNVFMARTTSTNYILRFFNFSYAVLLYNLWVLVDSIISICLFGRLIAKHLITAGWFGDLFYKPEKPPPT